MIIIFLFRWFLLRLPSFLLVLLFVAVSVYLLGVGYDLAMPMGQLWFEADSGGLNFTQSIIQRYLYYPLWDSVLVPILQYSGYLVLGVGFVVSLILMLIAWRI